MIARQHFTRARGFTLLELLVAITVLAIVSMIAFRGLESLVATRERLEPEADDVRALLTVFGQMERDLGHVTQPAFVGMTVPTVQVTAGSDGNMLIQLARIAPTAVDGATNVQTVFYRVQEGALLRLATPAARSFATVPGEEMQSVRMLAAVKSMHVRTWRPTVGWITPGIASNAPAGAPAAGVPSAVDPLAPPPGLEVTIERIDGRIYRRVLLVG